MHKAMLAMLPGEDRVIGTLMLSNRYGVVRDFSADDLKLFETLANNARVALQYDRLEQAIARLEDLQQQLRHQAFHDSLTDLPNRALFIASVREALDDAPRASSRCCSSTSTTSRPSTTRSATPSATSCWSAVADRLRSCVRPQDEIARLGGDEFAVRLHDAVDAEGAAESVAKRIMEAFQLPIEAGGELLSIRLSVGIASARQGAADEDELIRHADMAMYQAKMAGKALLRALRPRGAGGDAAPPPDEGRPAARRRARGELTRPLPADRRARHRRRGGGRGARALGAPRARADHAGRVHPARRGDRDDRRDRALRAARGLPAGPPLAGRAGRRCAPCT